MGVLKQQSEIGGQDLAGTTLVPDKTVGELHYSSYGVCCGEGWGQQGAVGDARGLLWLRLDMGSKQHGK